MKSNIDRFLQKYKNKSSDLIIIGKGGFGIVYLDPDTPDRIYKVCRGKKNTDQSDREYKIYQRIQNNYIDSKLCKLIKAYDYRIIDRYSCVMELTRVKNPLNKLNTIQALFGDDNLDYIRDSDKGRIMGLKKMIKYGLINSDNVYDYIRELATILARLHYEVKNDGFDIEVLIGKENDKIVLYIGDFDLTHMIKRYTADAKRYRKWGIIGIYGIYENKKLGKVFIDTYLKVADDLGYRDIAEKMSHISSP